MKRITVYADFDFLSAPQEIGILDYEHVRGKDQSGLGGQVGRLGRTGREAWADYPKPLGGLLEPLRPCSNISVPGYYLHKIISETDRGHWSARHSS